MRRIALQTVGMSGMKSGAKLRSGAGMPSWAQRWSLVRQAAKRSSVVEWVESGWRAMLHSGVWCRQDGGNVLCSAGRTGGRLLHVNCTVVEVRGCG